MKEVDSFVKAIQIFINNSGNFEDELPTNSHLI